MKKTFVVGIAGGSASGKSTFTDSLAKTLDALKVKVIHMDSYFKSDEQCPHPKAPITKKIYSDHNHPDSFYLPKLRSDLSAAIDENSSDIIIIEGLLTLFDDDICDMLDLRLFIDCRADERIVRRLKRNMKWGSSFDQVADVYLDMVRYRHDEYVETSKWKADFILNGSSPSEKALTIISEAIKSYM
jgi:uridine kinase